MRITPLVVLLLVPFAQADTTRALELLGKLDPAGKVVALGAAEKKLLADARDGKLRAWTLEEAALVASGVHDAKKRKEYLATIEDLAAGASRAVAEAKSPRDKGDALLRFLHAGPLKSYSRHQTSLDKLLDDGTYNCVSSAVLYNALGSRLGLDLRGVVIPGHAFSALSDEDGKVDVETTTTEGFDPVRRKKRVFLVRRDGVVDLGMRDPSTVGRREVRDAGLASLIYSNRAAAAARDKNYLAGALLGMRALCLDRDSPGANLNTLACLLKWAGECGENGRYQTGLQAVTIGLALDPSFTPLAKARGEIYQRWSASLEKTRPDAAVELLLRAVKENPELSKTLAATVERGARRTYSEASPSEAKAFLTRTLKKAGTVEGVRQGAVNYVAALSKALADKGDYARAVSAVEEHASMLGKTPKEAKDRAGRLTRDVYEAWGKALMDSKEFDAAAKVYREALGLFPRDPAFKAAMDRLRTMRRA
jgi:tetratricopeptide (TPR) repeat protein